MKKITSVKVAKVQLVGLAEAAEILRKAIVEHKRDNPPVDPGMKEGDLVRLDNGWLGMVYEVDSEGTVCVMYINENGLVAGPSYGYDVERIEQ